MSELEINSLRKNFGALEVLSDINLSIRSGEFVVFVGPSGCGKSTLLRCISGLEPITSGTISIDGRVVNEVSPSERGIAMVFQSYALYPHMTVAENMGYSLKLARLPREEIRRKVEETAAKLQLTDYLDRKPKALSGGQRQRVAIGRSIVRDPKVFLFDEPLSNLDAALRVQMRMEIGQLKKTLPDTTMIYVTHDQVEAMTMADRIVVLKDGEVMQVGTPMELYETPASLFVAQFIGSPKMNLMTGERAKAYGVPHVGVRPEHMEVVENGPWGGEVIYAENLGSDTYVYVDAGEEDPTIVRSQGKRTFTPGERIALRPEEGALHRFDETGNPVISQSAV
ncbi:ABC transporter ATP-binding protein [Pelagovum pacificum]|uniref:ABC transporter ATP-binding protein n=1 Tax=Pelagovum pacificum TaxID=2588711 RepID=A0A5C5GER7_9RHOB|nr:ABC transporter ATP-binding protein [Pelagovum pacificum]QQA43868.1 ABC transporter ATP-binding protein [Pelagovum pacificum]TNY33000.1 ABC transporter ATP-binding protein [Pelagovum pacificum]